MDLLVQGPSLGLNSLIPQNMLDPRAAASGSQNVFYRDGLLQTPWGFAKLDLTSGLNSGDTVLAIIPFTELDEYSHLIAVTTEKIYDHDRVNEEWDDKTQSGITMNSAINHPISCAEVGHDDTAIYIDDDTTRSKAYHHIVICDGGLSNIQRWAGRYEMNFANLLGAGGYHDGTTHRALQVSMSQKSRMLLLSPQTYSSSSNAWTEHNQRVRWPIVGKLETWTGTGSGFAELYETGGFNVWSASLGSQHIIYQTKGIWTLNYVGGTSVFAPLPVIPDLGLLSWHLLVAYDNVHYFIGTDYNVHAYLGGSVKQTIGDPIHNSLQADLDPTYKGRCLMAMGANRKRLWIFIVPNGSTYITKAYYRNMQTGAWGVRDFGSKYTSTTGITAVSLVGAQSYTVGDTYAEVLERASAYAVESAAEHIERYGDKLIDTSIDLTNTSDLSLATWKASGLDCTLAAGDFSKDFTDNDILLITDGSSGTNVELGSHFYTVYDVSTNGFSVRPRFSGNTDAIDFSSGGSYVIQPNDTIDGSTSGESAVVSNLISWCSDWAGSNAEGRLYLVNVSGVFTGGEWLNVGSNLHAAKSGNAADVSSIPTGGGEIGVADLTGNVPSVIYSKAGHDAAASATFYSACSDSNPGQTYRQSLDEVLVQPRLVLGDSAGLVYIMDETYTADDNNAINARHITPVIDWKLPNKNKLWPGLSVVAKGDVLKLFHRTSDFNDVTTGWTTLGDTLVAHYKMNDNAASTTVVDSQAYSNGTAQQNTEDINAGGKIIGALDFNGTDDYVDTNDTFAAVFQDSFTINLWCKPTEGHPATIPKLLGGQDITIAGLYLQFTATGGLVGFYRPTAGTEQSFVGTGVLFTEGQNDWHMVTAVFEQVSATTARILIYFDNALVGTGTTTTVIMGSYACTSNIYIGASNDAGSAASHFDGLLDNVTISSKALTGAERSHLYAGGNGTENLSGTYQVLTDDFEEYTFYTNKTSKRIQYKFENVGGSDMQVREYKIFEPRLQENR